MSFLWITSMRLAVSVELYLLYTMKWKINLNSFPQKDFSWCHLALGHIRGLRFADVDTIFFFHKDLISKLFFSAQVTRSPLTHMQSFSMEWSPGQPQSKNWQVFACQCPFLSLEKDSCSLTLLNWRKNYSLFCTFFTR